MLTGTNPTRHGVHDNDGHKLADDQLTLAEILREQGFVTGAVVGAFVMSKPFGLGQGFEHFDDDFTTGRRDDASSYLERRAEEGADRGIRFLERIRDQRFFLFLHFYDPHSRYVPPEPFATKFADNPYAGEIAYADRAIGRVIDALKELRLYASTLVVFTSDHGENLGEHGERTHSYFVWSRSHGSSRDRTCGRGTGRSREWHPSKPTRDCALDRLRRW